MERYRLAGRETKKYWRLAPAISVVTVSVIGIGIWLVLHHNPTKQTVTHAQPKVASTQKTIQPSSVAGHYLFNGTTVWSRGVEKDSLLPSGKYDYAKPFSQLSTFDKSKYDAWMTSFECPITDRVVSFRSQVSDLKFNCRPEYLKEAAKYFDLFDLANNHTGDQDGMTGLDSTQKYMDATPGVQYFGSFDPSVTQDTCEVVSMPVRLEKSDKTEQKATIPIAMCAWHYFFRQPLPGEIAQMDAYAKLMPVFAFVEMGTEYQPKANAIQESIAHQVVDHDPEFVIANNPHWVQNTEVYKGKLIVYATGNFIFDQLEPEEQRSASIDVTMHVPYDDNVAKWVALADTCKSFQDSCLQKAEAEHLTKVHPTLTYGVVAGQGGYQKLTHKADIATQAAVEQRMNWAQTLQKLGQ